MVGNNRRTKLLPKIIIGQFLVALLITTIALGIIFYAQGYRMNLKNFSFFRTGVVVLEYQPKDSIVRINDKIYAQTTNTAKNLEPGFYNIEVSKDGYTSWQLSLHVDTESVSIYKNIILLKEKIEVADLTDAKKIQTLTTPNDILADNSAKKLNSSSHEIWIDNELVTRLSTPIKGVAWYPDLYHIIYQQGNEIRMIESSGLNDTKLVSLSSEEETMFTIGNRGSELYYIDGGNYKVATIK